MSIMEQEIDKIAKECGFDSMTEFNRLVSNIDLTSAKKLKAFKDWQECDGSKDGLLKLKELI